MSMKRGCERCVELEEVLREERFRSRMRANTVLEEAEASGDMRLDEIGHWLAEEHKDDCGCGLCDSFQSWCKAEKSKVMS